MRLRDETRFQDLAVGSAFRFPSSRVMEFVKVAPQVYGSTDPDPSLIPIKLCGLQVYRVYKLQVSHITRKVFHLQTSKGAQTNVKS